MMDGIRARLQAEAELSSDHRFAASLASLSAKSPPAERRVVALEGQGGARLARATVGASEITIRTEKGKDGFLSSRFLEAELPALAARYAARGERVETERSFPGPGRGLSGAGREIRPERKPNRKGQRIDGIKKRPPSGEPT